MPKLTNINNIISSTNGLNTMKVKFAGSRIMTSRDEFQHVIGIIFPMITTIAERMFSEKHLGSMITRYSSLEELSNWPLFTNMIDIQTIRKK